MEVQHRIKEVFFYEYCPKCVHYKKPDDENPCEYCLSKAGNLDSHKPVKFVKKSI